MKNSKKLDIINSKISDLQKIQKQLENDLISDLSSHISKIIIKKKAYNLDHSLLLSKIESTIDEIIKQK